MRFTKQIAFAIISSFMLQYCLAQYETMEITYLEKIRDKDGKMTPEPVNDYVKLGDKKKFNRNTVLEIKKMIGYTGNIDLELYTGSDITKKVSYPLNADQEYLPLDKGSGEFTLSRKSLKRANNKVRLEHGSLLKIIPQTQTVSGIDTTIEKWVGIYTIKQRFYYLNKIKAPILYTLKGDLSGAEIKKLSPSFGISIVQLNTDKDFLKFVSFDGLGTYTTRDEIGEDGESKTLYSFSVGFVIDVGGIIQFGSNYDFEQEKGYFVLGFRVDAWPELYRSLAAK